MLSNFTIGKASCKLDCVDSNLQNSDIFVRSVMSGSPNVDISLTFCEKRINLAFAEQILKMLSSTISLLTSAFVNEPLMLKGLNDTSVTPRIPLAAPRREPRSIGTLRPCHPNHAGAINGLINSAWDIVMDAQTLRIPDVHSVPYYDAWGSLIPAAEMARYYSSHLPDLKIPGLEHATFSMEEIIDNPSMMQQHEMIIAKMQAPAVKRKDSHSNSAQKSGTVWGNHIRRLTVGGTSSPTPSPGLGHSHNIMGSSVNGGTGQSAPTTKNLSSEGSVESLTTGSSHSDHEDDELLDDLGMMGALSPRRKNQKGRSSVNKPSQILGVMV